MAVLHREDEAIRPRQTYVYLSGRREVSLADAGRTQGPPSAESGGGSSSARELRGVHGSWRTHLRRPSPRESSQELLPLVSGLVIALHSTQAEGRPSRLMWSGDEGTTEASGRTRRVGVDLEGRGRLLLWLWADADLNLSRGRFRDSPSGADLIPLASTITATAGLTLRDAAPERRRAPRAPHRRPGRQRNQLRRGAEQSGAGCAILARAPRRGCWARPCAPRASPVRSQPSPRRAASDYLRLRCGG
jgi:hypothetical protein